MSDHADAIRYAATTAELLLALRDGAYEPESLGEVGDTAANRLLLDLLQAEHPDDAVLSEESTDDARRQRAARVWIIDPLDGTREFTEPGRTDWAVHVALWKRGQGVHVAAVALPARGVVVATEPAPLVPDRRDRQIKIVVSRSRPPDVAARIAAALDGELVSMGSAGAKTLAVVEGTVDVYAHAGGQYEWDSAAPVAVAAAAGLHVSRLDGSPLEYNQPDPWLPDLLVCRPELADAVIAAARPSP